jgi:hypothetical protein
MRCPRIVALAAALLVTSAWAGKKNGITMPDTVEVRGRRLLLNGMGVREATVFKVDVYVAGLYLETLSSDPTRIVMADETKRLVLKFKRGVDREDIVKAWTNGFRGNALVSLHVLQSRIDRLNGWMPDFREGQTLVFTYLPGTGVQVDLDDRRLGGIEGEDFARSLLHIWLGPKPPTSDLKKGLLGNHTRS